MKEESLLLLSDLQKLINQVVLIDYTIIILGGEKRKSSPVLLGEDHGNWEETGKAPMKILRYMGNGMYERCVPELGRPYLSPDR